MILFSSVEPLSVVSCQLSVAWLLCSLLRRTTDHEQRIAFEPNIYLYDKYPGGIGLSEPLYRMSEQLLDNARKLIENCPCQAGCPSCVGPMGEIGEKGKEVATAILRIL